MIFRDGARRGSGGDFVAGFLLGGAVFGAVAYIFAPQVMSLSAYNPFGTLAKY